MPRPAVNMTLRYDGRYLVICVFVLTYDSAGWDMLRPSRSYILSSSTIQHRTVRITVRNLNLIHKQSGHHNTFARGTPLVRRLAPVSGATR